MVELFTKEGASIMTFKKGEVIMRVEPLKKKRKQFNKNLGVDQEYFIYDYSHMKEPFTFLGIQNDIIYLKVAHPFNQKKIFIKMEEGLEGWVKFEPLPGLTLLETLDIHYPNEKYLHDLKQKLNNKPIAEPPKPKNDVRRYWLLLLRYIGYRK